MQKTETEMDIEKKNMDASKAKETSLNSQIMHINSEIDESVRKSVSLKDEFENVKKKRGILESQIVIHKEKLNDEQTKIQDKK